MTMLESISKRTKRSLGLSSVDKCRRKFLKFFPRGFRDPKYFAWERGYKVDVHLQWNQALKREKFRNMINVGSFIEIGQIAARIESKTNLLFSFEKMAFRDAVKDPTGAQLFAEGLYHLLYGRGR